MEGVRLQKLQKLGILTFFKKGQFKNLIFSKNYKIIPEFVFKTKFLKKSFWEGGGRERRGGGRGGGGGQTPKTVKIVNFDNF